MAGKYVAIKFEGDVVIHATAVIGNYASLCGMSDDDDPECGEPADLPARPKITCAECQSLILHTRTYTRKDFSRGRMK